MKETQLFYLAIKLTKPFAVPNACTGLKTKRGILSYFSVPDFFKNELIYSYSSHIALSKFTGAYNFREIDRETLSLLSYQVNEAFAVPKACAR